jgi:GTP cyclohydrolase IA
LTPIELNVSFLDFAAARAGLEAPASPDGAMMEEQIRQILQAIGEDPNREGLLRTPRRVAQALTFLTRGYDMDPAKVINEALFTEEYEEMIVQKDIDFYSLCEHHLLPFFGKAHVAYIPHHKIVGISKLARLVDIYARRLQVQERMTNQIATIIMEKLDALGVAVVIEAEHLCMRMRGVEKQNSYVITSSLLGAFRTRQDTRNEFMTLIRQKT